MSDETYADRQLSLVQALHRRTKNGKVDWRETSSPTSFDADVDEYTFRIRLVLDDDYPHEPDYWLLVKESSSEVRSLSDRWIDTISNASLRPVMDKTTPEGLNPYALLRDIYELARRKALNVEDALDRILAALTDK